MNHKILAILSLSLSLSASAQHFDMTQWGADRGYTTAPYFRYEAEPGHCKNYSGSVLAQSDRQTDLQSEASNQTAISLSNGQFVEWENTSGDADGVTLRFSVPWASSATLGIFAGDEKLGEMTVNADHSWEFCAKTKGSRSYKPEYYSIHTYNANEAVRMRFDEVHKRLSRDIRKGEKFSIRNLSNSVVTVDFLEIEKTKKVEMQSGWVRWDQSVRNDLQAFIWDNQGKTIYIDQEYVGVWGKLSLGSARLQGRGMWYTELHWEQNGAGFEGFGTSVKDMYLSSYQNQRYASSDHGPNGYSSPGKCFNGNMTGATVENVWVEHFECGGWLSGTNGATFRHCRFRDNYADGINFSNSSNCTMEYSSFRNNGDDDMASWSAESYCSNNTFRYCTAEHNWRASSLGFFGGGGHRAENILVKDGLESGVRLVSDFNGPAFGSEGIDFNNISIVHCACIAGEVGVHGDFWGVDEGALHIEASNNYDIVNPRFSNFDIYDSRGNAVFIGAIPANGHSINNLNIENINVYGVNDPASYAFYFENPAGSASINNIYIDGAENITNINGGDLENCASGNFTLNTDGFASNPVEPVAGCKLRLTALAWESRSRAAAISSGDNVTFSIRIDNVSSVDLPADFPVSAALTFADGSSQNFPTHKSGIKAGDYAIVSTDWTATEGGHTVTATLDPNGKISSMLHEENSPLVKKFNIDRGEYQFATTSGVDFQVLDLLWMVDGRDSEPGKGSINAGDKVKFVAVVANTGTENSTEAAEKLGVTFRRNGMEYQAGASGYYWCDNGPSYETFDAGSVKYFPAYGGAANTALWTAEAGTHNFLMEANDSGDRPENNHQNNQLWFNGLTIPYTATVLHAVTDEPDYLFFDSATVGINAISDETDCGEVWYTISGLRLPAAPSAPGIYVRNNEKIVVK